MVRRGWLVGGWLLWAACGEDTTKDGSPPPTDKEDTGTTTPVETTPVPALLAWLAVEPGVIDGATGGDVTLTAQVAPSLGDPAPAMTWSIPTGESGDVALAPAGEGLMTLSFTVPPVTPPTPGPLVVVFSVGEEAFGSFGLSVGGALDLKALNAGGWNAYDATPQEGLVSGLCGVTTAYDADGERWELFVEVHGSDVVARACRKKTGWDCQETKNPAPIAGDGYVCGSTDHFRVAGTETNFAVLLSGRTTDEDSLFVATFDGETGTLNSTAPVPLATSGVVLALNTTKKDKPDPVVATMLSVDGDTGAYFDGSKSYAWTKIGDVTPADVWAGDGWAGLFTTADLSTDPAVGLWAWSYHASTGVLTAASPQPGSGVMVNVRTVTIGDPGFPVAAAAARGQDLDDDGFPELFLQVWGDAAQSRTWLVPGATDKSESRPVRELLGTPSAGFEYVDAVEGGPVVALSRLAGGGGKIRDIHHHPSGPWDGVSPWASTWMSGDQWDVADLMVDDVKEVTAELTGMLGRPTHRGDPSDKKVGLCCYGKCAPTGAPPSWLPAAMAGLTSADDEEPLDGDMLLIGPSVDGAHLVQTRGLYSEAGEVNLPLATFSDAFGNASTAEFVIGAGSALVRLPEGDEVPVVGASALSAAEATDGSRVYLIVTPSPGGEALLQLSAGGKTSALALDPAPRSATLLGGWSSADAVLMYWRDTAGAVSIGALSVDESLSSGVASFTEGPYALGTGAAPTGIATIDRLNPTGAVSLRGAEPLGYLVWSDQDQREGVYADGAPDGDGDGDDDTIVAGARVFDHALLLTVPAASACGLETWYLPPGDTIEQMIEQAEVVGTSAEAGCADLPIPVLAVDMIRDAPQIGVLAADSDPLQFLLPGTSGVLAQIDVGGPHYWAPPDYRDSHLQISGGDLTFDGHSEVVIRTGSTITILGANALGGFDPIDVDPAELYNLAMAVGGTGDRQVPGKGGATTWSNAYTYMVWIRP